MYRMITPLFGGCHALVGQADVHCKAKQTLQRNFVIGEGCSCMDHYLPFDVHKETPNSGETNAC